MKRAIYIPFDQLHRKYGALKSADPATDLIVMVESQSMINGADWHPERLFFLISSARHFAKELQSEGFTVDYRKATNTPTGQRQDISTTDQLTPNWLIPFAGQVSIATQTTERWLIADDCRRDAGVLPIISMRELLGPLPGFVRSDNQLFSQDGAPLWQSWTASALPDATGAIQSATGHGTGKMFIPGGEVISGDISWDYQRIPAPSMTIPSQHCNDVVLDTLTLPPTWSNRRMYGGAFLAESPQAPARSATDLRDTLRSNGWKITTLDTHTTPIVIQASSQHDTIRVFVVSNQNSGSDITIIAVTP
jgi:hypothetical protein